MIVFVLSSALENYKQLHQQLLLLWLGSVTVTNLDPDPYLRKRAACRFRS